MVCQNYISELTHGKSTKIFSTGTCIIDVPERKGTDLHTLTITL